MELEEAIQTLKDFAKYGRYYSNNTEHHMKTAINTVLNHLTKQEKMIENIFSYFDGHRIDDNICDEILNYGAKDCIHNGNCTECIKQYFEKKEGK